MLQTTMTANEATEDLRQTLFTRVARLFVMQTPHVQIAAATGLTVKKVEELEGHEEVRAIIQTLQTADLEQAAVVNEGWDLIEEEALGTVLQQVRQVSCDKDYALKAATLANKAQRRGNAHSPINGKVNTMAVITFNTTFIEKLQTMSVGMEAIDANAKRVDTLDVESTQNLFKDHGTQTVDDLFARHGVTVDMEPNGK